MAPLFGVVAPLLAFSVFYFIMIAGALLAVLETPKQSSGTFLQRWKFQNDRRETSCSDGNTKMVVEELLAAMESLKRSSGSFLQRWKHQNGSRCLFV